MTEILCPQCHQAIGAADAAFCPFCGEKLRQTGPDLKPVLHEPDPVKRHDGLVALQAQYPESLEVAEEILLLGRLYERGRKGVDFTIIKSYILNVYLEPNLLKKSQSAALRQEIFHHPDLDRCLQLADDKDAFLRRYLTRLSEEYIRLFLKGSSQHMRSIFGYVNERKAPKYLATPAAQMLLNMQRDDTLTDEQRRLLMQAFYAAFDRLLAGETQYLDDLMKKYSLSVETQ